MSDNLLESYNPLYDVHLRQYFALPHMQKHLRDVGLLENEQQQQREQSDSAMYAHHQHVMELLLRNRERVLAQMADLHKKLDAAEKVEICRRIRSGLPIHIDEDDYAIDATTRRSGGHASRSLSRPSRGRLRRSRTGDATASTARQRRRSASVDDSNELIRQIEADYRSDTEAVRNPHNIYNRLAASVYKYQYLHKMNDRTLANYKNSLRKQLQKLARFRELSFGPNSVAKHQPLAGQQTASWFFRRRSLPSLQPPAGVATSAGGSATAAAAAVVATAAVAATNQSQTFNSNKMHQPLSSLRKSREDKSKRASASEAPPKNRYGNSRSRASQRHQGQRELNQQQQLKQQRQQEQQHTQRLPPLSRRAHAQQQQQQRNVTTTGSKKAKLPPPTATVRPTIQQKLSASKANGTESAKNLEKRSILPEIEQLKVGDKLAATKHSAISPASSVATSSAPDADNEDEDSRRSVDFATTTATSAEKIANGYATKPVLSAAATGTTAAAYGSAEDEDDERAYSSRSSTSVYADSLNNDDAPLIEAGSTATETRPTPEPFMGEIDPQRAIPRADSDASLRTLNNGVELGESVAATPMAENVAQIFEKNQKNAFDAKQSDAEAKAHNENVEDAHILKRREVDYNEADFLPKENLLSENHQENNATARAAQSDSLSDRDHHADEQQHGATAVIIGQFPRDTIDEISTKISDSHNAQHAAVANDADDNEKTCDLANALNHETFTSPSNVDHEDQTSDAETTAMRLQQPDDTKAKYDSEEHLNTVNEELYKREDERQSENERQFADERQRVEETFDEKINFNQSAVPQEQNFAEHASTTNIDAQNEYVQNVDETAESKAEPFIPPRQAAFISDEEDTMENVAENRSEIGEYLNEANAMESDERVAATPPPTTTISDEHFEEPTESSISREIRLESLKPDDESPAVAIADEYDQKGLEEKWSANENLIKSDDDSLSSDDDYAIKHQDYSTSHARDVQLPDWDSNNESNYEKEAKISADESKSAEITHSDISEPNRQLDESSDPYFQNALKNELQKNLTPLDDYELKKSSVMSHRFPSTPQNSFSHLEDLQTNSANEERFKRETVGALSAENAPADEERKPNEEPIINENRDVSDGKRGSAKDNAKHADEDDVDDIEEPIQKSYFQPMERVSFAEDAQKHEAEAHYGQNATMEETTTVSEESMRDVLNTEADESRKTSDNIQIESDEKVKDEAKQSARKSSDTTISTHDLETAHYEPALQSEQHPERIYANKTLLDEEDLIKEGKGEITTYDGDTAHYNPQSSKHLSHDDAAERLDADETEDEDVSHRAHFADETSHMRPDNDVNENDVAYGNELSKSQYGSIQKSHRTSVPAADEQGRRVSVDETNLFRGDDDEAIVSDSYPSHYDPQTRIDNEQFQLQSLHSEDATNNNTTTTIKNKNDNNEGDSEWQQQEQRPERRHDDYGEAASYDDGDYDNYKDLIAADANSKSPNTLQYSETFTEAPRIETQNFDDSEKATDAFEKHADAREVALSGGAKNGYTFSGNDNNEQRLVDVTPNQQQPHNNVKELEEASAPPMEAHKNTTLNNIRQQQHFQLLNQPSIEITPASEYDDHEASSPLSPNAQTLTTSAATTNKQSVSERDASESEEQYPIEHAEHYQYDNYDNYENGAPQQISYSNGQRAYDNFGVPHSDRIADNDNGYDNDNCYDEHTKMISHSHPNDSHFNDSHAHAENVRQFTAANAYSNPFETDNYQSEYETENLAANNEFEANRYEKFRTDENDNEKLIYAQRAEALSGGESTRNTDSDDENEGGREELDDEDADEEDSQSVVIHGSRKSSSSSAAANDKQHQQHSPSSHTEKPAAIGATKGIFDSNASSPTSHNSATAFRNVQTTEHYDSSQI